MPRIVLCCAAGMSTSMGVTRMEKEAAARGLAFHIYAIPEQNLQEELQNYGHEVVAVLLGPQVKYMQQDLQKQADKYGIRVEPINMMDYGMQKGAAVLDFALSLIENKN